MDIHTNVSDSVDLETLNESLEDERYKDLSINQGITLAEDALVGFIKFYQRYDLKLLDLLENKIRDLICHYYAKARKFNTLSPSKILLLRYFNILFVKSIYGLNRDMNIESLINIQREFASGNESALLNWCASNVLMHIDKEYQLPFINLIRTIDSNFDFTRFGLEINFDEERNAIDVRINQIKES